ncbi:MAG: magnesium transporter CorA family protein [bacterium]
MHRIIQGPKVTWVDISNPNREDLNYLKKEFNFHPLVIGELIPPGYRPKVEQHKDYLFMILHYPIFSKEKRQTRPRELDIIVCHDVIITSHYQSILPLKGLFDTCNLYEETRKRYMSESAGQLLFYVLNSFWENCLTKLNSMNNRIVKIEKEIFRGKEKEMVLEISLVKTDIINFWRIIEPQKETLESLANEGSKFFGETSSPYFHDILGTFGQVWNGIKTNKETILALEDTNQSLLSSKINEIMKVLTTFSVVFLPLTLIASMWGMNFDQMPFSESANGFFVILAIMAIALTLMLSYFRKRNWL